MTALQDRAAGDPLVGTDMSEGPPLTAMLWEFRLDERWLTSGLLDETLLRQMYKNSLKDTHWQTRRLSADRGAGTEHWRLSVLAAAVRLPAVHDDDALFAELMELIELDPDWMMAGNIYHQVLFREELGFSDQRRLQAAMSVASRTNSGSTFQYLSEMLPSQLGDWCEEHMAALSAYRQLRAAQAASRMHLEVVLEWAAVHGVNARVRKYGRHGLRRKRSTAEQTSHDG